VHGATRVTEEIAYVISCQWYLIEVIRMLVILNVL
jgi:hypothetical protein